LGNGLFTKVGYRGTMEVLFAIGNLFIEHEESLMMQQWQHVMNKG
jgi:nitrogenase molybdenum-iron protein NifN